MRRLQAIFCVLCGALPTTSADSPPTPPTAPDSLAPPLSEIGSLCEDTIMLTIPAEGSPMVVTGAHTKLFSFLDCAFLDTGSAPATVYQMEGTGAMVDVFLFGDQFGSSQVAVFEGCRTGRNGNVGGGKYPNCVAGQYAQGARWQAKAGQLYTIVVYSFASLSSTSFILQIETIKASPICDMKGFSSRNVGTLDTTSVQLLGGSEDSVTITDLPPCDYQTRSSFVLYEFTVLQSNVIISASVEGVDSVVTVYQGNCESSYTCLPHAGSGDASVSDKSSVVNRNSEEVTDGEGASGMESQVRLESIAMPRANYNVHSFHNEMAGATYLVAVSSCCGNNVEDFRLTLNVTEYGNVCEDSVEINLSSNETSAIVNLSKGKVYQDLSSCHANGYLDSSGQQASMMISSPVAFYKLIGDGNNYIAYIAPSDPNKSFGQVRTSLYTTTTCNKPPECLRGDNQNNQLLISTVIGETYYLASYSDHTEDQGSYVLKMRSLSSKTPCEDATYLGSVGNTGLTVNGTLSEVAFYSNFSICNVYAETTRFRVFLFIAEKDGPMVATATKVDPNINFYPLLTVVTSCESGECIAGSSNFDIDLLTPALFWNAEAGVKYYVVVSSLELTFDSGEFILTVEPLTATTICGENVVDMGIIPREGAMFNGSTISGPLFAIPASCQDDKTIAMVSRSTTFTLRGDGNVYLLSVSDAFGFSPQATVFDGSCENLRCIPTDAYVSSFLVDTALDETYTIVIGDCCDPVGLGGTFRLHAKKVNKGSLTSDAMAMNLPWGTETKRVTGSTSSGSFYPGLPLCHISVDSPATVYKLDFGDGYFSAQVSGFSFDAQLSLLKANDLSGFECYGTHGHRHVFWEVGEAQSLYLVVHGCCDMNAVGDFSLQLRKLSISGEPCNDVHDLGNVPKDGLVYVGTSNDWFFVANDGSESEPLCEYENQRAFSPERSKLFTVDGSGKTLAASAFVSHTTAIRISLTVVKSFCGSVECIEGAYLTVDPFESITWPSVPGETYDIFVTMSVSETEDEFILMVYEDGTELFGSNRTAVTGLGNNTMNDTSHGADSSSSKLRKAISFLLNAGVLVVMFCCY